MGKHIHHDVIVAWAAGARIQERERGCINWIDCIHVPQWSFIYEYRVKPDYPASSMTTPELREVVAHVRASEPIHAQSGENVSLLRAVADAALRHACDRGQVVRREEFDRAVACREARDMAVAIAIAGAVRSAAARVLPKDQVGQFMRAAVDAMDDIKLSAIIADVKVNS